MGGMTFKRKRRIKRKAYRPRPKTTSRTATGSPGNVVRTMAQYHSQLKQQRDAIDAQINQLTEAMDLIGGGTGRRVPGRPSGRRNSPGSYRRGSVKNYILQALRGGGEMAVKDIAKAVKRLGYKTKSHNLPNQVSNALAQMTELTKVGRGVYRL